MLLSEIFDLNEISHALKINIVFILKLFCIIVILFYLVSMKLLTTISDLIKLFVFRPLDSFMFTHDKLKSLGEAINIVILPL